MAELKQVWWLDVKGTIETKILSPKTTYVAYLVYKFATSRYGFEKKPVDLHVELEESDAGRTFRVFLDPSANIPQFCVREEMGGWRLSWVSSSMNMVMMGKLFVVYGRLIIIPLRRASLLKELILELKIADRKEFHSML